MSYNVEIQYNVTFTVTDGHRGHALTIVLPYLGIEQNELVFLQENVINACCPSCLGSGFCLVCFWSRLVSNGDL